MNVDGVFARHGFLKSMVRTLKIDCIHRLAEGIDSLVVWERHSKFDSCELKMKNHFRTVVQADISTLRR